MFTSALRVRVAPPEESLCIEGVERIDKDVNHSLLLKHLNSNHEYQNFNKHLLFDLKQHQLVKHPDDNVYIQQHLQHTDDDNHKRGPYIQEPPPPPPKKDSQSQSISKKK